jgi:anti-anti-sigma factor
MPKLFHKLHQSALEGAVGHGLAELRFQGFIDAANFLAFEKALEQAAAGGASSLLVDFSEVHYINSTGISALIRAYETYRERGGILCLAGVAKPVGLSMHLLGVTSLIPFVKDLPAAREHVRDFLSGELAVEAARPEQPGGAGEAPARRAPAKVVLRPARAVQREQSKVLVITPAKSRFTRVLRLRFGRLNGDYHLMHDPKEALSRYDEIRPDLVVIDERCDPKGEFVSRLKVQRERSLTSVIKLYSKQTDVRGSVDFKIWENDYLVDPFEILELFSLTEAELLRVPKDRRVFVQQVHFEFKTAEENVEKAYKLSDLIIRHSLEDEEAITALYAAVKEGIDNAVRHGNRSSAARTIDVNFLVDHAKVTVIIEDEGKGFDYEYYLSKVAGREAFEEAKRRILDEGIRGGLGILLMSRCTDRIEYAGAGNILRLEKNI